MAYRSAEIRSRRALGGRHVTRGRNQKALADDSSVGFPRAPWMKCDQGYGAQLTGRRIRASQDARTSRQLPTSWADEGRLESQARRRGARLTASQMPTQFNHGSKRPVLECLRGRPASWRKSGGLTARHGHQAHPATNAPCISLTSGWRGVSRDPTYKCTPASPYARRVSTSPEVARSVLPFAYLNLSCGYHLLTAPRSSLHPAR